MDRILAFPSTKPWFQGRGIMPSSWQIPEEEKQRIIEAPLVVSTTPQPAATLPFRATLARRRFWNVVQIDPRFCDDQRMSNDDVISILLHEIGHVVNLPKNTPDELVDGLSSLEFYADDYVRHCGFETQWINLLEAMVERKIPGFETKEVDRRIARMREDSPIRTNMALLEKQGEQDEDDRAAAALESKL